MVCSIRCHRTTLDAAVKRPIASRPPSFHGLRFLCSGRAAPVLFFVCSVCSLLPDFVEHTLWLVSNVLFPALFALCTHRTLPFSLVRVAGAATAPALVSLHLDRRLLVWRAAHNTGVRGGGRFVHFTISPSPPFSLSHCLNLLVYIRWSAFDDRNKTYFYLGTC